MPVRGIRGATTAELDTPESITAATDELLRALVDANSIQVDELAFAYFTTTRDLVAEFPARAARELGWLDVPLLCGHDMDVHPPNPRAVAKCIRILLLYNTELPQSDMRHVYLRGATAIKTDLDELRRAVERLAR
ncbi:MAG TPA: chorismate mutase [Candidatus Dormibacteraeota bacterium]